MVGGRWIGIGRPTGRARGREREGQNANRLCEGECVELDWKQLGHAQEFQQGYTSAGRGLLEMVELRLLSPRRQSKQREQGERSARKVVQSYDRCILADECKTHKHRENGSWGCSSLADGCDESLTSFPIFPCLASLPTEVVLSLLQATAHLSTQEKENKQECR